MFDIFEEFYETLMETPKAINIGNCKRCMYKSGCGNKNKREAQYCHRYRPEIKNKKRRKR